MTAQPQLQPQPQHPEALARQLIHDGKPEEAEPLLRALLANGSGAINVWRLLSTSLRHQKKYAEARQIVEMLIANLPGDFHLRFDMAELSLMLGDFERGWREYAYRYNMNHTQRIERKVQRPRWNGGTMPGQTLLIHDEQGFGDTFQFLRLMPEVKRRSGAQVVLEVSHEALPFAQRIPGIDMVVPRGTLPPLFHSHAELMSLPMILGLKMDQLPGSVGYLKADPARVEAWKKRLAHLPRPLVAITWGGRATPDPHRSIPFAQLAPLAVPGVTFLSVQKGPQAADVKNPPAGMNIHAFDEEFKDFDDSAAMMAASDLFLCIDSAPLHLAGALNVPAYGMLLYNADWRWFQGRSDSPWYPSVTLFRQEKRGDWASVMNAIAPRLVALRDGAK